MQAPGSLDRDLKVGDLVKRRLMRTQQMEKYTEGKPLRFTPTADPVVYRVTKRVGGQSFAYHIVDNMEPSRQLAFAQPVTRASLVKLDMPELEQLGFKGGQRIELREPKSDDWRKGTVEKMAVDGRAQIRFDDEPQVKANVELASCQFRWLLGEAVRDWEAA